MKLTDKIRAWKDPVFRAGLSEEERMQLPANPAGMIELSGTALDMVAGGWGKSKSKKKGKSSGKSSKSGKSSRSGRSRGSGKC